MFRRAVLAWLGFVFIAGLLAAQPKPSSDLLLPWFEVDLESGEATTVFAVVNALDKQVDVTAALYTNWGLPVVSTQLRLKPGEVLTADLRAWIVDGHLPGKSLTAGEMLLVQALLSGQPSPSNGLYHSTDVAPGRATGYLTLRTVRTGGKKGAKPDALRGEGFLVDPGQGPARGHDLVNIDKATAKQVCNRHNLRHLSGTGLAEARVIVWRDLAGQILPAPAPVDRRRQVDVSVYAADGRLLRNQPFQLLPAEQVPVAELGLTEPLGRIEIATAEASVAVIQDSAGGPLFETSCVQSGPGPTPNPQAAVRIETLVNGQRAASPPGPAVPIGSTVNWSYRVTNSGSDPLTQISVRDDQGVAAACPKGTLNPGQSLTCTARTTAQACQHRNVGTVTAKIKKGKKGSGTATAQDPGHYFGEEGAAVEIVTSTNGADANVPTGPTVLAGSPIAWTYLVTNTGKVRLLSVRVSDDRGAAVVCPRATLEAGEAMTCEATGVAAAGQFGNVATVTGAATCGEVFDSDPSHYFGESDKNVQLRALVNGFDADVPPGPSLPVGSPVTWEYVVTNSGKFPLNGLAVSDDKGTAVSCPKAGLTAGESMTCIARGVAGSCQNAASASVTGQTPDGTQVAASNPAHYFGQAEVSIQIKTFVNGNDADLPPGPSVPIGTLVQWTYTLTNTGKVALSDIVVKDNHGTTASCPRTDLRPGETLSCTATATAVSGGFSNAGTVTAKPPCGDAVRDDDPSHYKGVGDPGIRIRTFVAGQDANQPPGPAIPVGNPVSWSYAVTNTGQFALHGIEVKDSQGKKANCPNTDLQPGQGMTCTSSGTAVPCLFHNEGSVSGKTSAGVTVTAVDPSYYTGEPQASVSIETTVGGKEADLPPGDSIVAGSTVTWAYKVINTGNAPLTDVKVTDDQGAPVDCKNKSALAPGELMECAAGGTAVAGQFRNIGTVTAKPACGPAVSAQDASHYLGTLPVSIHLQILVNGQHAASLPGPSVLVGSTVDWKYIIQNTGQAPLSGITASDDQGLAVTCPKTGLQPSETVACTGSSTVVLGQQISKGTASGQSPYGTTVLGSETSHYLGTAPKLDLELSINGQDADTSPGPGIAAGSTLSWTYAVTNTGLFALSNITVTDDKVGAVSCPKTALQPNEAMTCTVVPGTAVCGPYQKTGTATGTAASGASASDSDPAHHTGTRDSTIDIKTLVNGNDADVPPGPALVAGASLEWNYKVKNTDSVPLMNVEVTDSKGVAPSCPKTTLQPNEIMTCTAPGTVQPGQYKSTGTATGHPSCGSPATDDDDVHYIGG